MTHRSCGTYRATSRSTEPAPSSRVWRKAGRMACTGELPRAARGARALRRGACARSAGVAGQALFPDPQVLWQPAALRRPRTPPRRAARRRHARQRAPLLAVPARSARARGARRVVLDYRDEWSTLRRAYEMARFARRALAGDPLEAALLRQSHAVVTATEEFRENLLSRFPFLDPGRVFAIPNGYDPDDFVDPLPAPRRRSLRHHLRWHGLLSDERPGSARRRPPRSRTEPRRRAIAPRPVRRPRSSTPSSTCSRARSGSGSSAPGTSRTATSSASSRRAT